MFTIGKISLLVSLLFLCRFTAIAEPGTGRHSLSISPLMGMITGKSEENLYKYKDSDQHVSQLLWDLKPLFFTGFELDFGPAEPFKSGGFASAASLKFGLPFKTGIMEDRDWADNSADYLTHYSRHDAYSQNAILAAISAGYSWRITDFFVLGAYGEFSYMYFSWMAEDGFYQYSTFSGGHYNEWDESIPKEKVYGAVVRYAQNWFIFSPVLSVKGRIHGRLFVEGNISYSPLAYCADRDDHLLQDTSGHGKLFFGNFPFGHYINVSARLNYSLLETLDLCLSFSYRYITGLRDKTYYAITGAGASGHSIVNYEGGTGYSAIDINLAAKIRVYGRR